MHGCQVRHVGTLVRGRGSWDQICMGTTEAQGQLGQKSKLLPPACIFDLIDPGYWPDRGTMGTTEAQGQLGQKSKLASAEGAHQLAFLT